MSADVDHGGKLLCYWFVVPEYLVKCGVGELNRSVAGDSEFHSHLSRLWCDGFEPGGELEFAQQLSAVFAQFRFRYLIKYLINFSKMQAHQLQGSVSSAVSCATRGHADELLQFGGVQPPVEWYGVGGRPVFGCFKIDKESITP